MQCSRVLLACSLFAAIPLACGGSSDNTGSSSSSSGQTSGSGGSTASSTTGGLGGSGGGKGSSACSAALPGPNGDFKGYRMFPADHPINTAIDALPVNAQSATWLKNCSSVPHLQLYNGMAYNIVAASTPPVTATKLNYNAMPYPNPWPFPADAVIQGGDPTTPGDHHCLAFDVGDCKLYEVYNILWAPDHKSFTGASGTVWDTTIDDPGNGSGSDAAGMPITPLLIRYDELFGAGAMEHALRFTCEFTEAGHIAPARASAASTSGSGKPANPHDPNYPPMGMRVRLKASYDPSAHGFPPWVVATLSTLKKYGMLLADNGGTGTPLAIDGAGDQALYDATIADAYVLKSITINDLEVVDTGAVHQD